MPIEIDFNPVDHITADAIGQPGQRVFYIQAWQGARSLTLIVEKFQLQTLAVAIEQFMAEIAQKLPQLAEASADYAEDKMRIHPPVDPLFRIGEIGLGYDTELDLMVLVAAEALPEGSPDDERQVVRFWCSREQIRRMGRWGIDVVNRGRPICPQCGEPMDPAGHFCPKKNGHKH
ncbi:MAG: DUF3090 domain-containing protein [Anaerolineales bacterium]